ncbi:hypothetical protein LTR17_016580 [Elasticomyces elasticus]|nr:hypothetical protein LTR17_016580 [Elasticomyces elasticus]
MWHLILMLYLVVIGSGRASSSSTITTQAGVTLGAQSPYHGESIIRIITILNGTTIAAAPTFPMSGTLSFITIVVPQPTNSILPSQEATQVSSWTSISMSTLPAYTGNVSSSNGLSLSANSSSTLIPHEVTVISSLTSTSTFVSTAYTGDASFSSLSSGLEGSSSILIPHEVTVISSRTSTSTSISTALTGEVSFSTMLTLSAGSSSTLIPHEVTIVSSRTSTNISTLSASSSGATFVSVPISPQTSGSMLQSPSSLSASTTSEHAPSTSDTQMPISASVITPLPEASSSSGATLGVNGGSSILTGTETSLSPSTPRLTSSSLDGLSVVSVFPQSRTARALQVWTLPRRSFAEHPATAPPPRTFLVA